MYYMNEAATYAQTLRAIGQDLEERECSKFRLEKRHEMYVVQGQAEHSTLERSPVSFFKDVKIRSLLKIFGIQHAKAEADPFEVYYTAEEISRLENRGQSLRGSFSGVPELLSLSQILRAVGAYIDEKGGRLLCVSRAQQSGERHAVVVQYETFNGERKEEDRLLSNIYDLNVHMYKRRKKIAANVI